MCVFLPIRVFQPYKWRPLTKGLLFCKCGSRENRCGSPGLPVCLALRKALASVSIIAEDGAPSFKQLIQSYGALKAHLTSLNFRSLQFHFSNCKLFKYIAFFEVLLCTCIVWCQTIYCIHICLWSLLRLIYREQAPFLTLFVLFGSFVQLVWLVCIVQLVWILKLSLSCWACLDHSTRSASLGRLALFAYLDHSACSFYMYFCLYSDPAEPDSGPTGVKHNLDAGKEGGVGSSSPPSSSPPIQ